MTCDRYSVAGAGPSNTSANIPSNSVIALIGALLH
jgi:hypothetical protein